MIHEVRIFTKVGSSFYAAEMNIVDGKIETNTIDYPSLFSSMMSALLSLDSEVGRTQIKEFIYQENKAMLSFLDNIAFLVFADSKVADKDLDKFLKKLSSHWLDHFEDKEYYRFTNRQLNKIENLVNKTIKDVFWWVGKTPTMDNLLNIGMSTLTQPHSTYYIRYLSNYYHILSIIPPLCLIAMSQYFGVVISGLSTSSPSNPSIASIVIPILVLWIGPALFLQSIFGDKFEFRGYLTISALMMFYLFFTIIPSSEIYQKKLILPLSLHAGIFSNFLRIFLIFTPINVGFFGFLILTGISTSYANDVNQTRYLIVYTIVMIFLISLLSGIAI